MGIVSIQESADMLTRCVDEVRKSVLEVECNGAVVVRCWYDVVALL